MGERQFVGRAPESFGFGTILYHKQGGRATITLNRPRVLNAVNHTMLLELQRAFKDVSWDDSIGVLVLTGAGEEAFCSGADLDEQVQFLERPRDYWKWMGDFVACHEALRNLGKPTIARLNGAVVGGGNEFNMSCDVAVAVEGTYIRQVGTSHGSVALAGATQFLPLIVGDRRAREILFFNDEIPVEKALEWGLVNRVEPRSRLDEAIDEWCLKLLSKFPEKTRYTKQQLNFWRDLGWHLTIGHGRDWLSIHNTSPETREGVISFLQKREPDYGEIRRRWAQDEAPEWPNGEAPPIPDEP